MHARLPRIQDLDVANQRVFVRLDLNVPLKKEGKKLVVGDLTRIYGALPTIQHIIAHGGKCILASHLGRPDGKKEAKYSLEPVGQKLSELLDKEVLLTDDCIGDGPKGLSQRMRAGDVILLENLRFHPGEESNSPDFTAKLIELCDLYVNDAFGTLHRAHASTAGIPKLMPERRAAGFLVQKELEFLEPLRENPNRPFVLVMGGAKVSDKIALIENFLPKVDAVLVGGAMAYAFLKAGGKSIGKSLCDDKQVQLASRLLKSADARKVRLVLPVDHVVAKSIEDTTTQVTDGPDIKDPWMGFDVGPKTVELYGKALKSAETIFWNGPMGVYERKQFAKGTLELAKIIAESSGRKIAGGGDVVAALSASGLESKFDFVSTGGGATLEYLEGKELPGLKALEVSIPG